MNFSGETDHLTMFALLLDVGTDGMSDPCESDYTWSWVTLAVLLFAIYIVVLSAILIEVRYRRREMNRIRILRKSSQLTSSDPLLKGEDNKQTC
jgi:hypothetical protein